MVSGPSPRSATPSAPTPWRPVLAMLASALAFSLMGVCVKRVGGRIPAAEVVLVRSIVSVALSWWLLRRAGLAPWGQRRGLLVLRGAIGTVALLFVFEALARLPLASATVIQYLYPTFTALLAWLMLGERIGRRVLLAMVLGWLGVLLVAQPAGSLVAALAPATPLPPLAVLIAIGGSFCTALAYVSVRSLAASEHPLVIVFYFPLVALPLSLPLVALEPVVPTASELLWMLGVGLFTQLGQVLLTQGLTALPAAQATAIAYVQVAFAALWGWLVFGEAIDAWTIAGAGLVLAATLVSIGQRSRRASG